MNKRIILSVVVGTSLLSFPLVASAQQDRNNQRDDRRDNRSDRRDDRRDNRQSDRVRWQKVNLDQIPGEIKAAVGKQMGRDDKITSAASRTRDGKTVYFVEVSSKDRSRAYTVDESGKVIEEENTTEEGRTQVKYEELPGEVKRTLSKEAEGRPIKRVAQVTRGDLTYFVAQVDAANGLHTIRVDSSGDLLLGSPRMLSERGDRDGNRDGDRNRRADEGWDRRKVDPQSLPGPVKTTIGGQYTDVKNITSATELRRGDRSIYSVMIQDNNREYEVRVTGDGKVLDIDNETELGRQRVEFDSLPGEVKTGLLRQHRREDFDRVTQVTRRGETWYEAHTKDGQLMRVGRDGNLFTDNQAGGRSDRGSDRDRDRDRR